MSTYAVVQFLNGTQKECAVVPLIWLTDNNSVYYWPNTKSDVKFKAPVKSNAVYQSSMKKFDVITVLRTEDNYNAAEQFMNNYIEQVTSSDSSTNKKKIIIGKRKRTVKSPTPSSNTDNTEDTESSTNLNENNMNTGKIQKIKKHTLMKKEKNDTDFLLQRTVNPLQNQLKHITSMQSSSQQISNAGHIIKSIQSVSGVVKQSTARLGCQNIKETLSSNMETNSIDQERQSVAETSSRRSNSKIPRIKNFALLPEVEFQSVVLSYLQSIDITFEQIQSKINALLRHMNSAGKETWTKPEGLPKLPLSTMEQFEEMEKLLTVEENFNYYRKKLASIGGENQRCCVRSMLRLLLTNELATHFNWAGRKNKIAFKEKKIMDVIYESARLTFNEINGPSTGDKVIANAVKDWLKLANNRLSYSITKKNYVNFS